MNACPLRSLMIGLLLIPTTVFAQESSKATKGTVRAADGLDIVYETRGQGDTTLIFLHGWCGDRAYWKHQADAFAKEYRVITVDQAGHGESGKNRKEWTVASLAGDVEALVKSLGLKRVILIGHSMGGPVSLAAAKRLPNQVVAVIGVDTLQNVEAKPPEEDRKKFLDLFASDFKGTLKMGLEGMLGEKAAPELKSELVTRAQVQDEKMALGLMRDMMALDQAPLLKDAKKPVRCINSAGGYAFFNPTDIATNKKYADYNAVFIENVGHYPMVEKPAEFNQKLSEVLKEFAGKK